MKDSRITYVRTGRSGPEQNIENTTVLNMAKLLKSHGNLLWIGGSVPLGAGIPDIIAAIFNPQLLNLARASKPNISILSYLRIIGLAKKDTIARKLLLSNGAIKSQLEVYQEIGAVQKINNAYCMHSSWKNLISETVSVEAKVSNWKRAANQAIRNKLFSHYSYVAFPTRVANRVKTENIFKDNGLGILSIEGDTMVLIKNARKSCSFIWEYYYKLAYYIAIYYSKEKDAI
ncbi:MAG: hypothetical protein ACYSWZ_11940 [Planctomycetota bacterium]|jgi:hypothetical protein